MSIIKSLAVGEGDMFYIKHGNDSFTLIDCCMDDSSRRAIIDEIKNESRSKGIVRFISTHPDQDHLMGLVDLDDAMGFVNFYCVANEATKPDKTADFDRYCALRDDAKKAFHIFKGCSRRWMNQASDERGSAGINILWPDTPNSEYKAALKVAKEGGSPNNISCVIKYSLEDGATVVWMGDLESKFMTSIEDDLALPPTDILFAPHHGRNSGKVPSSWLKDMDPKIIVLGECPSGDLNYYAGYNTITQNSAGEIVFECVDAKVHVYVSSTTYSVSFLRDERKPNIYGRYIGTLDV